MIEKIIVICSGCKAEAVSKDMGQTFPTTCGMCGKITLFRLGNLKELQQRRNKWSRRISLLKKASLK